MTSTIKVNTLETASGSTLTIGKSGDTVTLASGASQSGFGRSGSVDWQTTPKTTTFTAASGEGYFINSGSALTMNLPAGSAGAIVAVSDYARNFETYNLTIAANGSEKIGGITDDAKLDINGQAATFVYVDSTKGWVNVQNAEDTETGAPPFIVAAGSGCTGPGSGCVVDTYFKVHTFTGPGSFTVNTAAGVCGPTRNVVSYTVLAGGGGGGGGGCGGDGGGGGGAGGFREYKSPLDTYTASPLNGNPGGTAITVTAQTYPITIGSGGAGGSPPGNGVPGSDSTFSTITSVGGGFGKGNTGAPHPAGPGGSGGGGRGGGGIPAVGGDGNTPPTTPAQGKNGGVGGSPTGPNPQSPDNAGAGGGGATAVGVNAGPGDDAGGGGAGATTSITGSPVARAGGGGGSGFPGGAGGTGGGGAGTNLPSAGAGTAGTANTGGGGGGGKTGGQGGSGVVIIRYKFQ